MLLLRVHSPYVVPNLPRFVAHLLPWPTYDYYSFTVMQGTAPLMDLKLLVLKLRKT